MVRSFRPGGNRPWKRGDRVIPYIRISKVGDREDTLISDVVQLKIIRDWIRQHDLVEVGEPYVDMDLSGRESSKRKIAKAIAQVRNGDADGIVVWKISRWGRNLIDSMLNVAALHEAGGFIGSGTENLEEIETPMGRFSLTQMLAIAQLQSDQIGETWKNIHEYRIEQGLPRSGRARFGYLRTGISRDDDPSTAFAVHPVQGPWLRKAYLDYVSGASFHSIVKEMRDARIETHQGNLIGVSSLRLAMDSGFAAGLLVDRRDAPRSEKGNLTTWNPRECQYVAGVHPPLIDLETWSAYVARRSIEQHPRRSRAVHRLTGLVFCASCGERMGLDRLSRQSKNGEPTPLFRCNRTRFNLSINRYCAAPTQIAQNVVTDAVLSWVLEQAQGEGDFKIALAKEREAEAVLADIAGMEKKLTSIKHLRGRYLDHKMLTDDPDEQAEMDTRRAELSMEIDELETVIAQARQAAERPVLPDVDSFEALRRVWEADGEELINHALQQIIGKVYISRLPPGLSKRYATGPARVRIIGRWQDDPQLGETYSRSELETIQAVKKAEEPHQVRHAA